MNEAETTKILRVLRTVWPDAPITADTIIAWMWAFEHVPYDRVEAAVKHWIRTSPFFPRPADLLRIVSAEAVAGDLDPERAWIEVRREVRRVGFRRTPPVFANGAFRPREEPVFSHPLIAAAVTSVGWETLCFGDDTNGWVRQQFLRTLERLIEREVVRVQTGARAVPTDATAIAWRTAATLRSAESQGGDETAR